jgi:hypothetical protein
MAHSAQFQLRASNSGKKSGNSGNFREEIQKLFSGVRKRVGQIKPSGSKREQMKTISIPDPHRRLPNDQLRSDQLRSDTNCVVTPIA